MKSQVKTNTYKKSFILTLIICIALIVVNVVSLTIAYFSATASGSSVIVFGEIAINASVAENNGVLTFDSNELMAGSSINRTLNLSVPEGSQNCYVRIYSGFTIDSVARNFLNLSIDASDSANWTLLEDKKYYYNTELSTSSGTKSVPIVLTIADTFGNKDANDGTNYVGKPYKITLYVEVVQSFENGTSSTTATGWPN